MESSFKMVLKKNGDFFSVLYIRSTQVYIYLYSFSRNRAYPFLGTGKEHGFTRIYSRWVMTEYNSWWGLKTLREVFTDSVRHWYLCDEHKAAVYTGGVIHPFFLKLIQLHWLVLRENIHMLKHFLWIGLNPNNPQITSYGSSVSWPFSYLHRHI